MWDLIVKPMNYNKRQVFLVEIEMQYSAVLKERPTNFIWRVGEDCGELILVEVSWHLLRKEGPEWTWEEIYSSTSTTEGPVPWKDQRTQAQQSHGVWKARM